MERIVDKAGHRNKKWETKFSGSQKSKPLNLKSHGIYTYEVEIYLEAQARRQGTGTSTRRGHRTLRGAQSEALSEGCLISARRGFRPSCMGIPMNIRWMHSHGIYPFAGWRCAF